MAFARRFSNEVRMRAMKYLNEGHTSSYVRTLLSKDGYNPVPSKANIDYWKKTMFKTMETKTSEFLKAESVLDSVKKVIQEFDWLHDKTKSAIESYESNPETTKEFLLAIREYHAQLVTAMKKLDMLKGDIQVTLSVNTVIQSNEFKLASMNYLELLLVQGKIEIKDPVLSNILRKKEMKRVETEEEELNWHVLPPVPVE